MLQTVFPEGQFELIENNHNQLSFKVNGIKTKELNKLRQIVISHIPSIAFDQVEIIVNESPLENETLAHRIGLIPIQCDINKINDVFEISDQMNKKLEDEYNQLNHNSTTYSLKSTKFTDIVDLDLLNESNHIIFTLDFIATAQRQFVYTNDLIWQPVGFQAQHLKPLVKENIIITKLPIGGRLQVICYGLRGTATRHAKWKAADADFSLIPKIILRRPLTNDDIEDLVDICPMNVFDKQSLISTLERKNPKFEIEYATSNICTQCTMCERKYCNTGKISIRTKNEYIFHICSIGVYSAMTVLQMALQIFPNVKDTEILK